MGNCRCYWNGNVAGDLRTLRLIRNATLRLLDRIPTLVPAVALLLEAVLAF